MRCETTADPDEFWSTAAEFLISDPVVHNVLTTTVLGRRSGAISGPAPATYLVVRDGAGEIVGAAMRTPPHNIVLTALPPAAVEPAVAALSAACPDAGGASGPSGTADAFATEWGRRTAREIALGMRLRIHRLEAVRHPAPVPGKVRLAVPADLDLVVAWTEAFALEAEGAGTAAAKPAGAEAPEDGEAVHVADRREVEVRVDEQRAWIWADDEPVCYAGTSLPAGGVIRIGPVYTPPERRRRGYASALVAALSQGALDAGATACALYTDVANPTSNKIYAAVGYRPVADVTNYRFGGQL